MADTTDTDVAKIVRSIVKMAKADHTSPNPKNPREGWKTDESLQEFDRRFVVESGDPQAYAIICRQAISFVSAFPEIHALVYLGIFRGERLLPKNQEREQYLHKMVDTIKQEIAALPEGTRKWRCEALLWYHAGTFYDAYGHYDLAAEAQMLSAQVSGKFGDIPGVVIGRISEAFYGLKHALITGKSAIELGVLFNRLEQRFVALIAATRGTKFKDQWGGGNGTAIMMLACTWLNRDDSNWSQWAVAYFAAVKKLGKAYEPSSELISALDLAHYNAPALVVEPLLERIAIDDSDSERKATAILVLARRAIAAGNNAKARKLVDSMPKSGAQHVRAVAEKIF